MQIDSNIRNGIWYALQSCGAFFGAAWVAIPDAAQWLIIAIVVDVITGMLAAGHLGLWSSKGMSLGLRKKLGELILVSALFWFDHKNGTPWGSAAAILIAVKEAGSAAENLHVLGVPIPSFLLRRLAVYTNSLTESLFTGQTPEVHNETTPADPSTSSDVVRNAPDSAETQPDAGVPAAK